ncbi:hypothetical protein FACS1894166_09180 [Bacilli bacterium]|nr:hypothetical protein FACS1894166_09180 [Bacilli bacterium]
MDTGHFAITCTLTIGGVADTSTPADLNIVNDYTFTPVPVTPTYFALNDAGDTVSGFSSAVKANYAVGGAKNMLAKFDTIDFQHSPVKYMAAAASFGKADADTPGNVFDA